MHTHLPPHTHKHASQLRSFETATNPIVMLETCKVQNANPVKTVLRAYSNTFDRAKKKITHTVNINILHHPSIPVSPSNTVTVSNAGKSHNHSIFPPPPKKKKKKETSSDSWVPCVLFLDHLLGVGTFWSNGTTNISTWTRVWQLSRMLSIFPQKNLFFISCMPHHLKIIIIFLKISPNSPKYSDLLSLFLYIFQIMVQSSAKSVVHLYKHFFSIEVTVNS